MHAHRRKSHYELHSHLISNQHFWKPSCVSMFFSSLCFALILLPFYCPWFIWLLFFVIDKCLVNNRRRQTTQVDVFPINRMLKWHRGTGSSMRPLKSSNEQSLPSFRCAPSSGLTSRVTFSLLLTSFVNSFKVGHREISPSKKLSKCGSA